MLCTSWGMYPEIECRRLLFERESDLVDIMHSNDEMIPRGNGRSYGDSALGRSLIEVVPHDCFLGFDREQGILHIQAGALLSGILEVFVPRGWFLSVTPGTKLITVGGAIASDVHGKNHHVAGCFSSCVVEFRMMTPDGEVLTCSSGMNSELFHATCGGMGLTGVILDAKIRMKRIHSVHVEQTTIKTKDLSETFEAFKEYREVPYSVAWIDCLASGPELGRALLMTGDFADDGDLCYRPSRRPGVPFNLPSCMLNSRTVRAFNGLYYGRIRRRISRSRVDLDTFFYPLDAVDHWNRIYGRNGFTQYQFILPMEMSYKGLSQILDTISASGKGSFLAVLKLYGPANDNYLSFPLEGYSLALDFKIEPGLFSLLDRLDELVLDHGGRIYLAKDVRVRRNTFEKGYPMIDRFRRFRKENGMDRTFRSLQSERVGI
ncbi:MAG: FAD-binding oxidoreductase [Deltaproteobacteria bacterium]|nr:FAD-binding oxidoreductase [Deltaproteobacteria bacterium]